jgi:hypothetical protein
LIEDVFSALPIRVGTIRVIIDFMIRNRSLSSWQSREAISDAYSPDTIESVFHRAVVAIYDYILLERRYDANRLLSLLVSDGGVKAVRNLLSMPGFGAGFEGLWQRGPLDKTIEYLVLQQQFTDLFTDEEKKTAESRLTECGYVYLIPDNRFTSEFSCTASCSASVRQENE